MLPCLKIKKISQMTHLAVSSQFSAPFSTILTSLISFEFSKTKKQTKRKPFHRRQLFSIRCVSLCKFFITLKMDIFEQARYRIQLPTEIHNRYLTNRNIWRIKKIKISRKLECVIKYKLIQFNNFLIDLILSQLWKRWREIMIKNKNAWQRYLWFKNKDNRNSPHYFDFDAPNCSYYMWAV